MLDSRSKPRNLFQLKNLVVTLNLTWRPRQRLWYRNSKERLKKATVFWWQTANNFNFINILKNYYPFFCLNARTLWALKLKRKTIRNAFTRNTLDEATTQKVVKISGDLDCLATFQLLNEKNNELLQLYEDILNNLLTSEKVEEDDIEKETISADTQI